MMRLLASGLFLLTAIAVFGVLAEHFPGDGGLVARIGIDLLLSFVVVLVHELGHAAAAVRLGGRVSRIVVFPFEYRVQRRRFGINKAMRGHEIGGYVTYTLDTIMARRKHKLIAAAGPAANILLAVVAGAVSSVAEQKTLLGSLTMALAILSFGVALANLVPFKGSDGSALFRRRPGQIARSRTVDPGNATVSLEPDPATP
jgi:Zn-dependent protease